MDRRGWTKPPSDQFESVTERQLDPFFRSYTTHLGKSIAGLPRTEFPLLSGFGERAREFKTLPTDPGPDYS